jgi:hypothetical protein
MSLHAKEKHLNISDFELIEERAVNYTHDKIIRIAVVLTTVVAWLSISNHCAVGALVVTKASSAPRMQCHGSQPSPSKRSSDEKIPCCKLLRATVASNAKTLQAANHDFFGFQSWIISDIAFSSEVLSVSATHELNTGPPFASSFAESVLQRSILAHAPPMRPS